MVASGGASSKAQARALEAQDGGFPAGGLLGDCDCWDHVAPEPSLGQAVSEAPACQGLARMLENCLSEAKRTRLGCSRVLVPRALTQRVARDVLRLASPEPYGLRGCVLQVHLDAADVCRPLARVACDPSVVPTFELTLVLKQDSCPWASLRDLLLGGRCSSGLRRTLILSPGFRLVKRKLYSLVGTTVIEES
ncbi:DNA damage-inducible transcript 4-like protein [Talpa occidentalis]|uniref:DNA damage-inducible transcript 4-like protein n=1 Tax=Talpa occidentalis TaxID=50954 RepID=UPI00188E27D3|nr:DNA damage-inducible transcript 4-like protein [Talpa occidentalis]XP_037364163.1 DNA damage-inducible transcript 4-like protein [Talpa occidentalis]